MSLNKAEKELLASWEEVFKKGLLSYWILKSIKNKPRYSDEIISYVKQHGNPSLSCTKQSLYRALRRYLQVGLVEVKTVKTAGRGPSRKYYSLSQSGYKVLHEFTENNIKPLAQIKE